MDAILIINLESPLYINGKPMLIAGLKEHYNAQTVNDIPEQWQRLVPYFSKNWGQVARTTYGVVFNMKKGSDDFDYLSGMEVADLSDLPEEFRSVNIPAHQYAVFSHHEHVSKLKDTMSAIWHKWLPESKHTVAEEVSMLERYGEGFNSQTGMGDIEVWIPIKG